jgi:hypothetical protein
MGGLHSQNEGEFEGVVGVGYNAHHLPILSMGGGNDCVAGVSLMGM